MAEILVYMTAPDAATARAIGRDIVERRLAACVNMLPGMESLYWWNGQVQQEREVVLLAKTTAAAWDALRKRVVELHPYEIPCIVRLEITDGHEPFVRWIGEHVRVPGKDAEMC